MTTNNKKGQYELHNIDAVKTNPIKNYINIQKLWVQMRNKTSIFTGLTSGNVHFMIFLL